jgi:hypothetical protein
MTSYLAVVKTGEERLSVVGCPSGNRAALSLHLFSWSFFCGAFRDLVLRANIAKAMLLRGQMHNASAAITESVRNFVFVSHMLSLTQRRYYGQEEKREKDPA